MTLPFALSLLAVLNSDAVSAWRRNDLPRAESLYRQALAAAPASSTGRAKVHSNLAALYKGQRRFRLAAKHYQHAIRLTHPHNAIAWNNLGEVRRLQGRAGEAIEIFQRAIAILEPGSPDLPILLYNLGAAHAQQGSLSEARRILTRAIELRHDPLTARLLEQLGTVPASQWQQVD